MKERLEMASYYYQLFNKYLILKDKIVMDLGCDTAGISHYFATHGAKKVYAVDKSNKHLKVARSLYHCSNLEFVQSTDRKIPLLKDTIDIIICIDTMEHLMFPENIFQECYRILKPGGIFLIHFQPWFGVYGGHRKNIIPIPWCQLFFSTQTLTKVSALIYDSDFYSPAHWDLDEKGHKNPNPFLLRDYTEGFLNKITLRQFRKLIKTSGFHIHKLEKIGFGGKNVKISRYFNFLNRIPLLDEIFVNSILCVLKKI
ncbi:MAG: class I SAM-dependent methyltransferase [Candidatus Hodarchaeales archaeon]